MDGLEAVVLELMWIINSKRFIEKDVIEGKLTCRR